MSVAAAEPRIGLALSGGGFRAAFFHAGVLTRLAQVDLLRHVRTLSCVSGGSVAGAVFYLALLRRLGWPEEPLREQPLGTFDFTAAAERTRSVLERVAAGNVRARVFANPVKNLTMFLSTRYSRTDRAGDMFDLLLRRELEIDTGKRSRLPIDRQLELRQVAVDRPDLPRLVLNATTLNSGHNWRFRPTGMGEEPAAEPTRRDVDRNDRFEWRRFDEICEDQRDFPLGLAVAASACFPGLFRPLPITRLFEAYRVDLMDGGAQDNQGVQALLDEPQGSYDLLVVSDGSGQLTDQRRSSRLVPFVVSRVLGVQGDRIREEQLLRTRARLPLSLVHLRRGIDSRLLRPDPYDSEPEAPSTEVTPFGVRRDVQGLLARVRTDLDAFSPLEALALEVDGYRIAVEELADEPAFRPAPAPDESWAGTAVPPRLAAPDDRLLRHLRRAASQLGRPWRIRGSAAPYWTAVAALAAVVAAAAIRALPDHEGRALLVAAGIVLLPTVIARVAVGFLERVRPALLSRERQPLLWSAAVVLYAGLGAAIAALAPRIADELAADWSWAWATSIGLGLLALPAVAPTVLALLLWLEGRAWVRQGSA